MSKELVARVTSSDVQWAFFHAGGKGGQGQNTSDSGVRVTHRPSGAVGESREQRSQLQNRRAAFRRMAQTPKFKAWVRRITVGNDLPILPKDVVEDSDLSHWRVEVGEGKVWRTLE